MQQAAGLQDAKLQGSTCCVEPLVPASASFKALCLCVYEDRPGRCLGFKSYAHLEQGSSLVHIPLFFFLYWGWLKPLSSYCINSLREKTAQPVMLNGSKAGRQRVGAHVCPWPPLPSQRAHLGMTQIFFIFLFLCCFDHSAHITWTWKEKATQV